MRHLLALLLILSAPTLAAAAESEVVRSARAGVSLVAADTAIAPGAPARLALRLRLAPGWHTYWRNPGDAGAPPELALTLPPGATAGPLEWPSPQRLPFGALVNFGYTGDVLLPFTVLPPAELADGDRLRMTADATWLVCADICVPEEGRFSLDLAVAATAVRDPRLTIAFAGAEAALPRPAPDGLRATRAGARLRLTLAGPGWQAESWRSAEFFPDAPGVVASGAAQAWRRDEAVLDLVAAPAADRAGLAPDGAGGTLEGTLVLADAEGRRAGFLVAAPIAEGPAPAAGATPGLLPAMGLALLGGLLLNLMPCVFPVLAMKAIGLARLAGQGRAPVRAHAASYTAGVLATTLALGGLLLALRAAGNAAGWGFQLTEPAFVAALAWLLLAIALNLSGVYRLAGPVGAGSGLAARGGQLGSFATGALAVLVATPCTAPFMAAALGAALVLPPVGALAVFGALGLGLALPYAMLVVAPGLARMLPKPGAWMLRLQQAMAFPMYAAAAWLVWVLAQQAGPSGLAVALGGAVLVGFAGWAAGAAQHATGRGRHFGRATAAAVGVGLLALLPSLAVGPAATIREAGHEAWSAARVAALQAEGRPVFVNFTAAWCLTCLVNERAVLTTEGGQALLADAGVAQLTGDWTRGDKAIGALLRSFGREGVPLYLLYPAGGGAPLVLPQVLTAGALRQALATAPRVLATPVLRGGG